MAFIPRLTSLGILGNLHWFSNQNPYEATGYGMPNCTAYAWGRFWEIADPLGTGANKPNPNDLPGYYDGGLWWNKVNRSVYQTGNTPRLGAVICFDRSGYSGHVGIVEVINDDGSIITSNSAWNGSFFYTQTLYPSNNYSYGDYVFQGFIYNPYADQPTPPASKENKFPWVLYARKLRNRNKLTNHRFYDIIL